AVYFYIIGLFSQPSSFTYRTFCLAAIPGKHHPVLYCIILFLQFRKKIIKPAKIGISVPGQLFPLFCELRPRCVDGETELRGIVDQLIPVPAHALASPGEDGVLVYGYARIGDYQIFVYTYYISVPFTFRAGPERIVKTEKVYVRLEKLYAVPFEFITEIRLLSGG